VGGSSTSTVTPGGGLPTGGDTLQP
jgi:hypothetical protein